MSKPVLAVLVMLSPFALAACDRPSVEGTAVGASATAAANRPPAPSVAVAPSAPAPPPPSSAPAAAEPESGAPIPAIDAKLPVEKLDLAAFSKVKKEDKAKLVGKKLRLQGSIHMVSYNAMLFDERGALHGPVKEGATNAVYQVEIHGAKAPGETWSKQVASCFVDAKAQKELLADFNGNVVNLSVEGVVEATFNDLAPCRVISKKVAKK
jgi:hypothetical protein